MTRTTHAMQAKHNSSSLYIFFPYVLCPEANPSFPPPRPCLAGCCVLPIYICLCVCCLSFCLRVVFRGCRAVEDMTRWLAEHPQNVCAIHCKVRPLSYLDWMGCMLCGAALFCSVRCCSMLHCVVLCCVLLFCPVLCCVVVVLFCAVCAMLFCVVFFRAVLFFGVLFCTVLFCAAPCCSVLSVLCMRCFWVASCRVLFWCCALRCAKRSVVANCTLQLNFDFRRPDRVAQA